MQFRRRWKKVKQNRMLRGQTRLQSAAMKIAIAADHAGYQLKDSLKKLLDEMGVLYEDFGTTDGHSVDYPDFAKTVAEGVAGGLFDRGILVCGTGVGMAIAANKVAGVRSAPSVDTDTAKLSRQHNDLNVLTLGARVLPESRAREIVKTFIQTPFDGGRHAGRVSKIHAIEPTSSSSRA
jgi:ribose 5-phosphate isomerase B